LSLLNESEIKALHEALDDEYRAFATYEQVIADFGEVRPFTNIRNAEARHIDALYRLFAHYQLPIPKNDWVGKVEHYSNVDDACKDGITAEISNGKMYERLLTATRRPDILAVLRNLQAASQQRHLPAFRRCYERRGRHFES
jgi:hypothetical protein